MPAEVSAPLTLDATAAPSRCDVVVVGGGIVGLAVARELALRHPHAAVCVLEREQRLAAHQSGHNSGVIHAGIHYQPGSLKARLCVTGARELYDYCVRNEIAHERCGKVLVATTQRQLPALEELLRRARANGVPEVARLTAQQIGRHEPHARGLAAIHSPASGIVDFHAVALSYARDVLEAGGQIVTRCAVTGVRPVARGLDLHHDLGVVRASQAVFCAGLWSDRLAVAAGAAQSPRIVPFRGAYLRLRTQRRELVRAAIYPVPDPGLPFLGVHLSRRVGGDVLIGPTALMVGARDAYRLRRVRLDDVRDTLSWPGSWRLLSAAWRPAVSELAHALVPRTVVREAARLVPELDAADVEPAFAGVRAQALWRDGRLVEDFVFSCSARALHVRNAPSPAATSSLAIARLIVDEALSVLGAP